VGAAYNIYCDESCHLEHDGHHAMALGAVWCPKERARDIAVRLRALQNSHQVLGRELKWTKVSPSKSAFYQSLVDFFFDSPDLHFRAIVIPDKSKLDHVTFNQTHDTFYYKMYFQLLKVLLDPKHQYFIYLDIKDTRSASKVHKLQEVLTNNLHGFGAQCVQRVQTVRSHEVAELQLTDLLLGAVSYANRQLSGSDAKAALVRQIRERSHYSLTRNTPLHEPKFNVLVWEAATEP
jgi:Protein of unknown function (DUF3800)